MQRPWERGQVVRRAGRQRRCLHDAEDKAGAGRGQFDGRGERRRAGRRVVVDEHELGPACSGERLARKRPPHVQKQLAVRTA